MATISDGTTSLTPVQVLGYESTREARTVLHTVVGSSAPAVTLRPAGLRTGTLVALVLTLTDALELEALLAQAKEFTLTDEVLTGIGMTFVASGGITVTLDDETRARWLVSCDFQEVTA